MNDCSLNIFVFFAIQKKSSQPWWETVIFPYGKMPYEPPRKGRPPTRLHHGWIFSTKQKTPPLTQTDRGLPQSGWAVGFRRNPFAVISGGVFCKCILNNFTYTFKWIKVRKIFK